MRIAFCIVAMVAFTVGGCAQRAPLPPAGARVALVPAAPDAGFHHPYLLRLPRIDTSRALHLLVEPNNSGYASPKFDDHVTSATALTETGVGAHVSRQLTIPLLMPVFPRPPEVYTHSLNRRALLATASDLQRLDLQLLAMVADARRRLAESGVPTHDRFFLTGFSASGSFVNRFTMLHPESVQAAAAGAVNGILMLPFERVDAVELPFPLGTADLPLVAGRPFQRHSWRSVPQFFYMGANDDNDAVQFEDAYTESERQIVYQTLGRRMLPDRWERCQALYREAGAAATFTTYAGVGHGTNGRIHADIAAFFVSAAGLVPR